MRYFVYIIFLLFISIIVVGFNLHKNTSVVQGNEPFYTGSDSCKKCHSQNHKSWAHSSHPKIFKEYTHDSQILADFENKPDFVKFDKKDIELIIGYQWEQVFAKKIGDEYYPLPAKWMELTKTWIPYKTKTWKQTPLTQKCNGCHTTGLDEKTGEFSEFGVSCESCHGPGSAHVQNKSMLLDSTCNACHNSDSLKKRLEQKEDIVVSVKSAVCGQCHSRGTQNMVMTHQTQVQFNFPVEYLPGQNISQNFKATTPATDKKGKNWWGNGVSKNRHQEYADFAKSRHASSLKNIKTKKREFCQEQPKDSCLKCHSADYISDQRLRKKFPQRYENKEPITFENAKDDITCIVCHNPHKVGNKTQKASDMCIQCHTKETKTMKLEPKHYPCPTQKITCADCHMPKIVETGGEFSLRSHAFKIIPPEATIKYGMPNSCQNGSCHTDKSTQWAIDEYHKFYDSNNTKKTLAQTVKEMK